MVTILAFALKMPQVLAFDQPVDFRVPNNAPDLAQSIRQKVDEPLEFEAVIQGFPDLSRQEL